LFGKIRKYGKIRKFGENTCLMNVLFGKEINEKNG
jgi:hypothetical protein